MKFAMQTRCAVVVLAGLLALAAPATERIVPSPSVVGNAAAVIALTNALRSAVANDVITLSEGVYDLTGIVSEKDNATYGSSHLATPWAYLTIRGDPAVDREKVVLRGDGTMRILRLGREGCWVRNLTFTNGYVQSGSYAAAIAAYVPNLGGSVYVTNCVFRGNRSLGHSGVIHGGTLYDCLLENNTAAAEAGAARYGKAYDCTFRGNYANTGGAVYQMNLYRCLFERNTAKAEGGACKYSCNADGCIFIENASTSGSGGAMYNGRALNSRFIRNSAASQGGAIGCLENPVTNCYFESNWVYSGGSYGAISVSGNVSSDRLKAIDCFFTNNASGWGNAVCCNMTVWSNCTFVSNHIRADAGGNAGPGGGTYYRCTFRDPWCTGAANNMKTATNDYARTRRWNRMCAVVNGTLYDCTIEGPVDNCRLTRCTISNVLNVAAVANCTAMTNCLVAANRVTSDDSGYSPRSVFAYFSGTVAKPLCNCTVVGNRGTLFNVQGTNVVNTLFADNVLEDGTTSADISVGDNYATGPAFDHCLYRTKSGTKGTYADCVVLSESARLRFVENSAKGYPYYMPRASSQAVDRGKDVGWTASDTDLGGYPRVKGSAVDIGCYEAWAPLPGMTFSIW